MGILDFLFGKSIKIEDPFFGTMVFTAFKKKPENNYFECRRHFTPLQDIIEIGINADETGPTEAQKNFFKQIETHYDKVIFAVKPLIIDEFKNWKEDFEINDFHKEFWPVYLSLPRCEEEPFVWEIAFDTEHDLNHTISITMNGFTAIEILIDG